MPKNKLTDYSATNASNTDVGGINIDEGMLPSDVNNAIREVMTHLKEFEDGTNGITKLSATDAEITGTGAIKVPVGTTAQRPTPAQGQIRYNTTDSSFEGYDGSAWGAIGGGSENSFIVYEYTATASQTTFSGADDNAATLSYTAGNIQVMLNGVVLDPSDYTATNGTSVVLASGAALNDVLNVYAFTSFTVADTVSASAGGTFSANVAVTGDLTVDTNTLYVDSTNNRAGIGTTSPYSYGKLTVEGGNGTQLVLDNAGEQYTQMYFLNNGTDKGSIWVDNSLSLFSFAARSGMGMNFYTNNSEAMRIDTSGTVYFKDGGSSNPAIRFLNDTDTGIFRPSANTIAFTNGGTESARIDSSRRFLIGKTTASSSGTGHVLHPNSASFAGRDNGIVYAYNRNGTDGGVIQIMNSDVVEGTISVSGTTVTYGGGHLARWSRLSEDSKDTSIVKGTVMTNLDAMVVWHHEAQPATYYEEGDELPEGVSVGDEKTPAVAAYDEDNEQLNKMAVSSVEGDVNVAGVFVSWDDDDEWNDFYVAMTGDMIIRIASGTTVARGDLLMSAGDGTAKPQGDDIVRSKTIAKVTSTNVSHTYDDGSYCVPCVLMAC